MPVHVRGFVVDPEHSFLNLSRIQSCRWSFRVGIALSEASLDEHVISKPVWINPNTSFHSICVCHVLCRKEVLQGLSRSREIASDRRFARSRLSRASFLYPFFLKEHQDQFVSFRFCEVWPVQLSPGQRARNSTEPTNQSWSNQLLLIILGSCNQGFDLKSVVVQTLGGQTVETRTQLEIVIIWHLDGNQTATCSASSVARSVQLGSRQYFNIE